MSSSEVSSWILVLEVTKANSRTGEIHSIYRWFSGLTQLYDHFCVLKSRVSVDQSMVIENRRWILHNCLVARPHHRAPQALPEPYSKPATFRFLTSVSLIRLPVFCGQLWLLGRLMFSGIQMMAVPTDANLANHALSEESTYRFHAFSADDAVTLV